MQNNMYCERENHFRTSDVFLQCVTFTLKTSLNCKITFKAIKTFAVQVLKYTFGIFKWQKTELDKTHTYMDDLRIHAETPRHLQQMLEIVDSFTTDLKMSFRLLHGRHPHELSQSHVDISASNVWLIRGELFPEMEDFLLAIQDQAINSRQAYF